MTSSARQHLLGAYLNDHLAGATGGCALARRIARTHEDGDDADLLHRLAAEIEEDRKALLSQMGRLGVRPRPDKALLARVAELVGRAKPNGSLLHRTPLTPLFELEMMALGVAGKAAGWRSLLAVAAKDERLDSSELQNLMERAEAQAATFEELRMRAAHACFGAGRAEGQDAE